MKVDSASLLKRLQWFPVNKIKIFFHSCRLAIVVGIWITGGLHKLYFNIYCYWLLIKWDFKKLFKKREKYIFLSHLLKMQRRVEEKVLKHKKREKVVKCSNLMKRCNKLCSFRSISSLQIHILNCLYENSYIFGKVLPLKILSLIIINWFMFSVCIEDHIVFLNRFIVLNPLLHEAV